MSGGQRMNSNDLQTALVEQLAKLLPSAVKVGAVNKTDGVDLLIELSGNGLRRELALEVKLRGHAQLIDQAISQLRRNMKYRPDDIPMIGVEFMPSASRLLCKEAGVGYVDTYGNMFLEDGWLLVDRETADTPPPEQRKLKSLFTPKASRAVRRMLETAKSWSILELAGSAEISVGMAGKVLNRMVEEGFVDKDKDKRYTLSQPSRLLDEWANAYDPSLHAMNRCYAFFQDNRVFLNQLQSLPEHMHSDYCLTGPAGASLVLPWTTFKSFHVLVRRNSLADFRELLSLRDTEAGANVTLIVPADEACLWGKQNVSDVSVASDLQLYLDLMKSPARGIEHATAIREQRLMHGGKPL